MSKRIVPGGLKGVAESRDRILANEVCDKGELKAKALHGGGAILTARIVNAVCYTGTTIVLARFLDPADYGLVAMVTAVSGFFSLTNDFGLADATIQEARLSQGQASNLFWINTAFGLLLTFLFMVMAPQLAAFFGEPRLTVIAVMISTGFFISGITTQLYAVAKRNLQFPQLAKMEIAGNIGSSIIAVFLAVEGAGYWALVFRQLAVPFTSGVLVWIFSKWRPGRPEREAETLPLIRFGANTLGSNLIDYLNTYLDKIMIGRFLGSRALGFYHNAFHLFLFPLKQLSYPFIGVAVSSLSKLRNNPEEFRVSYRKAVFFLAFIGMPVGAFLSATSVDVIGLLLGPSWEKTALLFSIFALSTGPFFIYSTVPWLHLSLGNARRKLRWSLLELAVFQSFFLVGLFLFNTEGVAIGYSLAVYILLAPALNYAGRPIGLGFRDVVAGTYKLFIGSAVAGFIVYGANGILHAHVPFILLRLAISGVLMVSIYSVSLLILERNASSFHIAFQVLQRMFPQLHTVTLFFNKHWVRSGSGHGG
jgi:polysaccharide transporter, PST family